MKSKLNPIVMLTLVAATNSTLALAQDVVEDHRCERDSLDNPGGHGRLDWALNNQIIEGQTGVAWTPGRIKKAREYWDESPNAGRPLYPTYGVKVAPNVWNYPGDYRAPTNGAEQSQLPAQYVQSAMCTASCYRPEMRILLPSGYLDIRTAKDAKYNEVIAVSDDAALDNLQFKKQPLSSYTVSLEDFNHDIAVIKMENGNILKVTFDHTFVTSTGEIQVVTKLKAGDSLVRADGSNERISAIEKEKFFGKVYNVTPQRRVLKSQIVVTEGYLTGSAYFQNVELTDANRHVFRRNIDTNLIK